MLPNQYGFLTLRNWRVWGDESQEEDILCGRYMGNYGAQSALEGWLIDSTNVIESVLVDGAFALEDGMIVDALDPRAQTGGTVNDYYVPSDVRLEPATFHGALAPGETPWFASWSYLATQGLIETENVESKGRAAPTIWACNYDASATADDGSCEFTSCTGCTYEWACNYDASAVLDDGTCERESCGGCTFVLACNYNPAATQDDGSCTYEECQAAPSQVQPIMTLQP